MMPAVYATKEADEGKGFVSTVEASGAQYSRFVGPIASSQVIEHMHI